MSVALCARAAALEVLLAHFPNVPFLMLDLEKTYGPDTARDVPAALAELREKLESELRHVLASSDTANTAHTIEE